MFQSEMKESAEGRIKIDDIVPVVLKEMLRYLYCGSVENNEGIHLPLFIAADKYDIKNLKTMCEIILTCQVTPVNALEMYTVGEMHGGLELKKKSLCILKK
jgi:speckle-type POZ protein